MNTVFKLPEYCPEQIISGALHYFRVHPGLWDDRLDKAVAFGLNTIETYTCWNCHNPHPDEFNFSGILDLELFIRKVADHGLKLILRPGPYICAEWDNGGLPGWLLALPGVQIRRMNQPYLEAVKRYFDKLLPLIKPYLATAGGPVIMMQIENEYGSYGNDKEYLKYLKDIYLEHDIDIPLFTSDGPYNHYPLGGALPGTLLTANFGTRSEKAFSSIRILRPDEPDVCMEFWDGWYDNWGKKHQLRPAADGGDSLIEELTKMLSSGAHVNLYMFHGGTSFGMTAGANGTYYTDYAPIVTSYDYDCPLSECGDPTQKFFACQEIIRRYSSNPRITTIFPAKKILPSPVVLTESVELFRVMDDIASVSGNAVTPPTMEELGENFGMVYYRKTLTGPLPETDLRLFHVNDFTMVWQDGNYLGNRMRDCGKNPVRLNPILVEGSVLELLVENTGRINYGPYTGLDRKGIVGSVCLDIQQQFNWFYRMLPLHNLPKLNFEKLRSMKHGTPVFYKGEFQLAEIGETFLRRPGVKGMVWINGFPLGRYWNIGPTETLYVPSAALQCGKNEIVVLEMEQLDGNRLIFSSIHELGEYE